MSLAGALLALAPIGYGVLESLPAQTRVLVATLLTMSHGMLFTVILIGLAAVSPRGTSQPRQETIRDRWQGWIEGGDARIFAAALYRDFAGTFIETTKGTADSPLTTQRELADRRMRLVSRGIWVFSGAMLLVVVAGTITLWGLQ